MDRPPGSPPGPACDACVDDRCCAESAACAAEEPCVVAMRCQEECAGDAACVEACSEGASTLTPTTLELMACQLEGCAAECGLDGGIACADLPAAPEAPDPAGCEACIEDECCEAHQAIQTPVYLRWRACVTACDEPACVGACAADHAEGAAIDDAIRACVLGTCKVTCQPPGWCGAFQFGADACEACALPACCAVHEACTFDTGCLDFIRLCWATCSSEEACRGCLSSWAAEDVGLALAAMACIDATCADPCGSLLGQSLDGCGLLAGLDPPACEACLEASCCAEAGACWTDPGCAALEVCLALCGDDAACRASCVDAHPTGVELLATYTSCRETSCAESCP